ncbi:MAG: alkaline phosphatase family protein, partial [Acidobacteriota bacterium]
MSWLTSRRPRPMLLAGLLTIEGLGVGAAVTWLTVRTQPIPPWSVGDLLALLGWLLALYGSIAATFGVVAACVEWLAVPRLPDHPAWRVGWRLAALVPCLVFAAGMIWRDQPAPIDPSWPSTTLDESIVTALDDPPPVVLLVIDGADLDAKILPLIDAGDLPTFAGLMREGTWGELASLRPTRSPVLWTSIITGQPARRHGIQGFVHPHLAGIDRTLRRFPFGSGLNRKLLPRLERGGFAGIENQPFTSADRRARPLWDIVAEHHPVGVYRWLVTWPASPTRGFMVAGGVYAGLDQAWTPKSARWIARQRRADDRRLDRSWRAPLDLFDRLSFPTPSAPEPDAIARYVAPGATFDPGDPGIRLITQGLKDPAGIELPILIDATRPKFVAANVFTVDTFQHVFDGGRRRDARRSDGSDPFAGAVA